MQLKCNKCGYTKDEPKPEADRPKQIPDVIGCDSGWIKCADRLPERNQFVDIWVPSVWIDYKRITTVRYNGEKFLNLGKGNDYEPSHWRPLPDPPNHGRQRLRADSVLMAFRPLLGDGSA